MIMHKPQMLKLKNPRDSENAIQFLQLPRFVASEATSKMPFLSCFCKGKKGDCLEAPHYGGPPTFAWSCEMAWLWCFLETLSCVRWSSRQYLRPDRSVVAE